MVVVPLVYPFGIRIGRMRILGPTAVTIIFVIGGLALLAFTVREIMQARKLIAQGGEITVEGGKVTIPVVRKKRSSTSRSCFRRWNTPNSTRRKTNSKFRCPPTITSSAARFRKRGGVRRVQVHFRQIALPAGNSGRSANTTYGNLRR
ncbi:MAG: hypothetical protein ACLRSE_10595 [Alistipes finegoldii]